MAIWDKVRTELDRAGRAAQQALDEGRLRLDAFRARQHADKAAQALGYAVYRARSGGGDLDIDTYARLSSALAAHEAEAARLESKLDELRRSDRPTADPGPSDGGPADSGPAGTSSPASGPTAGPTNPPPTEAPIAGPTPDAASGAEPPR
jgi:hypothetical protein